MANETQSKDKKDKKVKKVVDNERNDDLADEVKSKERKKVCASPPRSRLLFSY